MTVSTTISIRLQTLFETSDREVLQSEVAKATAEQWFSPPNALMRFAARMGLFAGLNRWQSDELRIFIEHSPATFRVSLLGALRLAAEHDGPVTVRYVELDSYLVEGYELPTKFGMSADGKRIFRILLFGPVPVPTSIHDSAWPDVGGAVARAGATRPRATVAGQANASLGLGERGH